MRSLLVVLGILVVIGLVVLRQFLYVVDATEQVIILRFGEVIGVRTTPGLYAKAPFVDNVIRLDKRILRIDAPPVAMPDREKQNLVIDSYARYRITDPVQFRQTLQTENNARRRLGDIITSILRDRVALRNRLEIIGSVPILDETGIPVADEEGLPLFEGRDSRTEMMNEVFGLVRLRVAQQHFGVEMIDVRIKRVDFPESVTPSIFTRMRAERNHIATRFRAEGDSEATKILAEAEKQKAVLLAEAENRANTLAGEGEAQAIDAIIQELGQSNQLTHYQESLENYKISRGFTLK